MQVVKNVLSAMGAVVPILYCAHLIPYFMHVGGDSAQGTQDVGLGPTVIGLGVVALVFGLIFIWRIMKLFNALRPPGGSSGRRNHDARDDDDGFDADAAIARYMAQRPAEAGLTRTAMPSRPKGGAPGKPTGFGRRV